MKKFDSIQFNLITLNRSISITSLSENIGNVLIFKSLYYTHHRFPTYESRPETVA